MTEDKAGDLANLSVLVIDDETFMLNLIGRILDKLDIHDPKMATNGTEALEVLDAADTQPDVILLDLSMPGMDGIEFLRHAAERGFSGGIGLISGQDERVLKTVEALARAHDLNILGSLSKPVTLEGLSSLLANHGQMSERRGYRPSERITEAELRAGLEGDQLTCFFQPKVSVATKELVGVETLVRWIHPERGIVPPDAFISLAEEHNLIDALTEIVFVKAMRQGGAWRADGWELKVAVNISMDNLNRLDFPEFIVDSAASEGMDPGLVILEVTESRLLADIIGPLEILTRLRLKNIGLSIDDFGTGYSSMEQLKRIPFNELKIDRAFVNGAARDQAARAILESSVDLAKKLGMMIVAEGVEDQDDWDLVESLGVDLVQGWFVGKAMPGDEIPAWNEQWKSRQG